MRGNFISTKLVGLTLRYKASEKKINLLTQNVLEDTDGVHRPPPLTGVGAPHQCPLGKLAMLLSLYADVRSIWMVL